MAPRRIDHWIDGKPVPPATGRYLTSHSPVTGAPVAEVAQGTEPDAAAAALAAQASAAEWAALGPAGRARLLTAVAHAIRDHVDELAQLEAAETGKPYARMEIEASADYFDYYASVVRGFRGEAFEPAPGSFAFTRREPFGVVAIVTPWNGPFNQASRDVAPALAVGNCVVVKPSEFTSSSTLALGRLASEAGLPSGVLNVVSGLGAEVGEALLRRPEVLKIAFTGSVATGRRVATLAAERLVPVTLELGGKSAVVVFADAPRERAVAAVAAGFTMNAGQVCSATTRLLVERSVHDELVEAVAGVVSQVQPGVTMGPLITPQQFEKVTSYFNLARAEGVTCVVGGEPAAGDSTRGYFVRPTVYTGVAPDSPLVQEEIFGPVLVVLPFDSEDEAITLANNTDYGLVASVWTKDSARALRVASRLQAGQISVNGGVLNAETPFGGYKNSGIGRVKGLEALHTYTQVKSISIGSEGTQR